MISRWHAETFVGKCVRHTRATNDKPIEVTELTQLIHHHIIIMFLVVD